MSNDLVEFKPDFDAELSPTEYDDLRNFLKSSEGYMVEKYCLTHQKFIMDFDHEETDDCEIEHFAYLLDPGDKKNRRMKLTHGHVSFIKNRFPIDFDTMKIFRCSKCPHQIEIGSPEFYRHEMNVFEFRDHKLKKIKEYKFESMNLQENKDLIAERDSIINYILQNQDDFWFFCKECNRSYNLIKSHELYLNCQNKNHHRFIRYPVTAKTVVGLNRKVADSIIEIIGPIFTILETGEIRTYRGGVCVEESEERIKSLIEDLTIASTTNLKREIIDSIKSVTYKRLNEFDVDDDILNLRNGLFNLATHELKPHTIQYPSLIQYPFDYDPTAKCPVFDNYLKTSISDERMRIWAIEMACLIFLPKLNLKKSLILIGSGDGGKSQLLSILEKMSDPKNCAALTIHEIENDRFASSHLVAKSVNISHDMSSTKLLTSSTFKNLIDHRPIYIQKKGKNGFTSVLDVQYFFSLNQPMEIAEDSSEGVFNRIVPVLLPNQFKIDPSVEDLAEGILPADPQLEEKLVAEIPGIFNKLLESLEKVKAQRCISDLPNAVEIEKLWRGLANPVQPWIDSRVIRVGDNHWVTLQDAYSDYRTWSLNMSERPLSFRKFLKRVGDTFDSSTREDPRFGTYSRCYTGIKLVEDLHFNLISYDGDFTTTIKIMKENFSFDERGLLKCKKCQRFEKLQSAIKHDCGKTNTTMEDYPKEHAK